MDVLDSPRTNGSDDAVLVALGVLVGATIPNTNPASNRNLVDLSPCVTILRQMIKPKPAFPTPVGPKTTQEHQPSVQRKKMSFQSLVSARKRLHRVLSHSRLGSPSRHAYPCCDVGVV